MSTSRLTRSADDYLNPERIRVARMRRGLTKVELAQRLAVTPRTVGKYETEGAPSSAATAWPTLSASPRSISNVEKLPRCAHRK